MKIGNRSIEFLISKKITLLLFSMVLCFFYGIEEKAYGIVTEWNSNISVGIMDSPQFENGIEIKIETISVDGLKIEWNNPPLSNDLIITGYEISRKSLDGTYEVIIKNTNSTATTYFDLNLPPGYYGYKIIPITEKKPSDQLTMHGIDRQSNLFLTYVLGQELLAKSTMNDILNGRTIQNNSIKEPFSHYYNPLKRTEDPVLQNQILLEISKAEQLFSQKYNIQTNH